MTEGRSDNESVAVELLRETAKAWQLDDGAKEFWFPKSQGELYKQADGTYTLFAPLWIMKEKGLI